MKKRPRFSGAFCFAQVSVQSVARSRVKRRALVQPLRRRHLLRRHDRRSRLGLTDGWRGGLRCGFGGLCLHGGRLLGGLACGACACCVAGAAGLAAATGASPRGGAAFGSGTVRLATCGIEAGGRGGPLRTMVGGGSALCGPVRCNHRRLIARRHAVGSAAGMKRMIRPSRASITSRPSSPRRSITAMV